MFQTASMKKFKKVLFIAIGGVTLSCTTFANTPEVDQKTSQIKGLVKQILDQSKNKEKDLTFIKNLFVSCQTTCKDQIIQEVVKNLLATFDTDFGSTGSNNLSSQGKTNLIDPTKPFILGGIEYNIKSFHVFDFVGNPSIKYWDYRKTPKNDKFVTLEFSFKNVSNEDNKYVGDFIITNWEQQYEKDSTASTYWKYQMWYDANNSLRLKKGVKTDGYQGFDMKQQDIGKGKLFLEAFANEGTTVELDISKIPVKNNTLDISKSSIGLQSETTSKQTTEKEIEKTQDETKRINQELKESEDKVIRAIKNDFNELLFAMWELKEYSFKDGQLNIYLGAKNNSYQTNLKDAFYNLDTAIDVVKSKLATIEKKSKDRDLYGLIEAVRNAYDMLHKTSWALLDANNESILSEGSLGDHEIWMNQKRGERIGNYAKNLLQSYENMLRKK